MSEVIEPRTERGEQTRQRLLVAARKVYEERGFHDTRVGDICDGANLAHGTFYIYFKTKEDIFYSLVDSLVTNQYVHTLVPPDFTGSVVDRFAYTLRQYFDDIIRSKELSRVLEQAVASDEKMRDKRLAIRREFGDRIQHGIERLQSQGVANPDISAEYVAEAIVSMVNNFGYMTIVLGEKPNLDIDLAVETLSSIWARALGIDPKTATPIWAERKQAKRKR
jgi:AcrR family transcriptional regulator